MAQGSGLRAQGKSVRFLLLLSIGWLLPTAQSPQPSAFTEAAQDEEGLQGRPSSQEPKKNEMILTEAQLAAVQRRLDRLAEQHQQLAQAIAEIKAELAIIQVRVTN